MKKILLILMTISLFTYINASSKIYNFSSINQDSAIMNQVVSAMADQLTQNKNFVNIEKNTIAITSFVNLDNIKATSRLGHILSENFIHEMQVRGYKIIDFKTMNKIKIDSNGDFLFSRDISKLRTTLNVDYALTGTYVKYRTGIVVNARIISLKTHIVLSTAQILIPRRVVKRISTDKNQIVNFTPNKILLSK